MAIIDLSPDANQPMRSADGRYLITYNGEIYNYAEIRNTLRRRGRVFTTDSDTEVILQAFAEFDVACLQMFRGMFAFVIWDSHSHRLFAARDRLGKKPLCYRDHADGITLASEVKALLACADGAVRVNSRSIARYLELQYVPDPETAFEGIRRLPPAHYLLVERGHVEIERYWRLEYAPKLRITDAEAEEEFLSLFEAAVAYRLVSDVPVGAFLSGGLDSALVVAMMARQLSAPVATFTIGFDEPQFDERRAARLLSERFGTNHTDIVLPRDCLSLVADLSSVLDEPFADSSLLPLFALARETRAHVKVVLSGDGGDENFAGYERYTALVLASLFDRVPTALGHAAATTVERLTRGAPSRSVAARLRAVAQLGKLAPRERHAQLLAQFNSEERTMLLSPEFPLPSRDDVPVEASEGPGSIDELLRSEVEGYLPGDLLRKLDMATMAHGLEARAPLLDHTLMEFCARLPTRLKMRGLRRKILLRSVAARVLPPDTADRPKKGFSVPMDRWLRLELRDLVHDVLLSPRAEQRGYFRRERVRQIIQEHMTGSHNRHAQIWNLLILELWHRRWVDRSH